MTSTGTGLIQVGQSLQNIAGMLIKERQREEDILRKEQQIISQRDFQKSERIAKQDFELEKLKAKTQAELEAAAAEKHKKNEFINDFTSAKKGGSVTNSQVFNKLKSKWGHQFKDYRAVFESIATPEKVTTTSGGAVTVTTDLANNTTQTLLNTDAGLITDATRFAKSKKHLTLFKDIQTAPTLDDKNLALKKLGNLITSENQKADDYNNNMNIIKKKKAEATLSKEELTLQNMREKKLIDGVVNNVSEGLWEEARTLLEAEGKGFSDFASIKRKLLTKMMNDTSLVKLENKGAILDKLQAKYEAISESLSYMRVKYSLEEEAAIGDLMLKIEKTEMMQDIPDDMKKVGLISDVLKNYVGAQDAFLLLGGGSGKSAFKSIMTERGTVAKTLSYIATNEKDFNVLQKNKFLVFTQKESDNPKVNADVMYEKVNILSGIANVLEKDTYFSSENLKDYSYAIKTGFDFESEGMSLKEFAETNKNELSDTMYKTYISDAQTLIDYGTAQ